MRQILNLAFFFACLLPSELAWSETLAVPELTGPVVDLTQTLAPNEVGELARVARARNEAHRGQLQVLMVSTLGGEPIEAYANRVFHAWHLGRKGIDDGVLIVVAVQDRKMRIEVGRGFEGAIPDVIAKRITADEMAPYFKRGQYYQGIQRAFTLIEQKIDEELTTQTKPARMGGIERVKRWLLEQVALQSVYFIGAVWSLFAVVAYLIYRLLHLLRSSTRTGGTQSFSSFDSSPTTSFSDSSDSSSSSSDSWSGGGGDSAGGGSSSDW